MIYSLALTALLFVVQVWRVLVLNSGTLVLSQDDPYITLDLADQMVRTGIYGINPGVMEAPSSSILWPFLLIPAALSPWPAWGVLLPGILFTLLSVFLIAGLGALLLRFPLNGWKNTLFTLANVLALQLPDLAWCGLEFSLQVCLVLATLYGLFRLIDGGATEERRPAWWLWGLIVVAPLVRYECFLTSAAALGLLLWMGHWRRVLVAFSVMVALPALFSLFLLSHGLYALPSSIILKKMDGIINPEHDLWFRLSSLLSGIHVVAMVLGGWLLRFWLGRRFDGGSFFLRDGRDMLLLAVSLGCCLSSAMFRSRPSTAI